MRLERPDLRPVRSDFKPERPDLRPEGPDGEGDAHTHVGTNQQTNEQTKVPLCSTGLRPLQGHCPKSKSVI